MKHVSEDDLILHYYGEPSAGEHLERHLEQCGFCRQEWQKLQRALAVIASQPVPERSADYEEQLWRQLAPRLGGPGLRLWLPARRWVLAGALAALLVAAFVAGRMSRPVPQQQLQVAQIRQRLLLLAVGEHLERTQIVLVELRNAQPRDISFEQTTAADLLEANRLYRQTAASAGDAGTAEILDDLERVLIEIVHSPATVSPGQLEELKQQIDDRGILVKVKTLGSQIEQKEAQETL
jgi:hypothetical protein